MEIVKEEYVYNHVKDLSNCTIFLNDFPSIFTNTGLLQLPSNTSKDSLMKVKDIYSDSEAHKVTISAIAKRMNQQVHDYLTG